jgi:hypothetical protein
MTEQDINAEAARIVEAAQIPFTRAMQAHADIVALVKTVRLLKKDGSLRALTKHYTISDAVRMQRSARMKEYNKRRIGSV